MWCLFSVGVLPCFCNSAKTPGTIIILGIVRGGRWDPNVDFYLYPCTKFNCDAGGRVTQNKYSVIFEYLGFLYWAIACAGMTQAIDVMDDTPAETKMKAFVTKQRGTAAKKRAGSITPAARGYTALSS